MKYWKRISLLVLLLQTGGVGGLDAQFLDWIHKMTGPGFARLGIQQGVDINDSANVDAVNFAALYGWRVSDGDGGAAAGTDINMQTLQATLEAPILGSGLKTNVNLLGVFGIALHRFGGGDIDGFFTGSFPAQVVLRFPLGSTGRNSFRLGTGFNIFWYPDDAFGPLALGVETDGFEAAWGGTVGFDIRLH